jgi:hypothetical protein
MTDKPIRASYPAWKKLREAAYRQNSHIKTILDDILLGKIDPVTMEKI